MTNTIKTPFQMKITPALSLTCREESKKIKGCPRPEVGSTAFFIKVAVFEKLKKIYPRIELNNNLW